MILEITLAVCASILYFLSKKFSPFSGIPITPVWTVLYAAFVKGLTLPNRMWYIYPKSTPDIDQVYLGNWALKINDAELAGDVLRDTNVFQKFTGSSALIFQKYLAGWPFKSHEEWRKGRKEYSVYFPTAYTESFMLQPGLKMIRNLTEAQGAQVNVEELVNRFVLDVIGRGLFGYDFNALDGKADKFLGAFVRSTEFLTWLPIMMVPFTQYLFLFSYFRYLKEDRIVRAQIIHMAEQKRSDPNLDAKNDILSFLVCSSRPNEEIVTVAQATLFAGVHTTAAMLGTTLYFLARYPEVQERVFQEVVEKIGPDTDSSDFMKEKDLHYLTSVLSEAIRLYPPPVTLFPRFAAEDTTLGGHQIPKGTILFVDTCAIHSNRKYWGDDFDKFNPDRFMDQDSHHPFAWIPFGGGPRICQGKRLAMAEARFILAAVLQNFEIRLPRDSPHQDYLKAKLGGVLEPKDLKLEFIKRTA